MGDICWDGREGEIILKKVELVTIPAYCFTIMGERENLGKIR